MKTMKCIAGAVLALAGLVACNQKEESLTDSVEITITASQEGHDALTKTAVENGGTQVFWEPSDEIKVFFKGSDGRFISQNTEKAAVAEFKGTMNVVVDLNEGDTGSDSLWGLYPYRQDATSDGASVTTTLPDNQIGRAGSFAKNTHITLGRSTSLSMGFFSVCGGLRFSLTQAGIKKVTFEANNGEAIAGTIKMAFENGVPVVKEVTGGKSLITLTAPAGGTFEIGKWYYIEAIPGTLAGGYTMMFYKANEEGKLQKTSSVNIERSKYGSLTDADKAVVFSASQQPDPNEVIVFADPIAKYACVEKFDTNGDGEVSYGEAAATTSLDGLFKDWNTVSSFDEIQYFTGVTSTEGVFAGCANLKSIVIPEWITSLGTFENCTALESVTLPDALSALPESCFYGCSSLKSVTLPTGITAIPDYGFMYCSSLTSLDFPSTLTSIGHDAFGCCTSLAKVDLPLSIQTLDYLAFNGCESLVMINFPDSLTSIGYDAFGGCSSLESVALPKGVSVGARAFYNCTSLASVELPKDMTSIPQNCFYGCAKLSSITWPSELISIELWAFDGCSFKDNNYTLELPASVKSIGGNAFGKLHHLVLPSTSPISIEANSFKSSYTYLYVPANMVEMYKVRTNWSNYADHIRSIDEYPVGPSMGGEIGEAVDLGLSVKWASWNVGASAPEEYGEYFAWGETDTMWKISYNWTNYKWCNGDYNQLTKYCPTSQSGYWDGAGLPDDKTQLDPEDDAAHVNWGGSWRMPTDAEWSELRENCTWTWTTQNGIRGRLVTSKTNGNSIFLPAAGRRYDSSLNFVGSCGDYWSASLYTDYPGFAWGVYFNSDDVSRDYYRRYYGFSVRPVTE